MEIIFIVCDIQIENALKKRPILVFFFFFFFSLVRADSQELGRNVFYFNFTSMILHSYVRTNCTTTTTSNKDRRPPFLFILCITFKLLFLFGVGGVYLHLFMNN